MHVHIARTSVRKHLAHFFINSAFQELLGRELLLCFHTGMERLTSEGVLGRLNVTGCSSRIQKSWCYPRGSAPQLWWIFSQVLGLGICFLGTKDTTFQAIVWDSSWALKSCLRIAPPSITAFFHMLSPYREATSPFVYNLHRHHRADRIPLSAPLSAQRLSYWAPADPNSRRLQFPSTVVGIRETFLKALLFAQVTFPRVRPMTIHQYSASTIILAKKYFWFCIGCPLRNSSQSSSKLLKTLKPSVTNPSPLCPVCSARFKESCFLSFSTQISCWFLPSAITLLICHLHIIHRRFSGTQEDLEGLGKVSKGRQWELNSSLGHDNACCPWRQHTLLFPKPTLLWRLTIIHFSTWLKYRALCGVASRFSLFQS